ncbi:MAG: TatD DNase family protein [Gammaproteobacteria bacterium]|jgi:TatD DNase family protein|nr:TatD DNase family protein [Gammaproteobacteria bacterium]
MFLVDSHCHLDQLDSLSNALDNAKKNNIGHLLCVCITLKDFPSMLTLAEPHPHVSVSIGLHPNEEVGEGMEPSAEELVKLVLSEKPERAEKIVAIGETGLDYYRSAGDVEWQRERFRQHMRAAKMLNKPLIVHTRAAREDTLALLKEEDAATVGGVLHCFTEDWAMAKAALDLGFYISFSGIITFKNAKELQTIAQKVPLERMLIETDSPYLAPEPYRGKSNEPAYVRYIADYIAQLRGIDVAKLADQTTANFFRLFKEARQVCSGQ